MIIMKKAKITVEFTIDFEDALSLARFQGELTKATVNHTTTIHDMTIDYKSLTQLD